MTGARFKEFLISTGRMVTVAIITTAVILAGLTLAFGGSTRQQQEVAKRLAEFQVQTFKATLASACVLSLPVDPETGRDPELVDLCFTQYDLEPPLTHN